MSKLTCKHCKHYYQHYGMNESKIYRLYCGHCGIFRTKRKLPDSPVCDQFVPGTPDEVAFVSKEYLSKALLQYMTDLELLPEIADIPKCNKDSALEEK